MTFKLSNRSLEKLDGVDERLVAIVKHAIGATKIDFGVYMWAPHNRRTERARS